MNQFKNVYQTQEYQKRRKEYLGIFDEGDFGEAENASLDRGYSLEIRHYKKYEGVSRCSRSVLYDTDGRDIFAFETVDHGEIADTTLIFTVKGREYLFFKEDLYGYSLLDISGGHVMHYVPAGDDKFGESFIIAKCLFCVDISAVLCRGCFWASPDGMCLCDVSDPMSEPAGYLMMEDIIDPSGELRSGSNYFEDISLKEIKDGRYIFTAERYIDKTDETVNEEYAFTGEFLRGRLAALKGDKPL